MNKILVFIPAYRCQNQVGRVIEQFNAEIQAQVHTVLLVDNRSPDETLEVAIEQGKKILKDCEFVALKNVDNFGLGGSHKTAFRYAIDNGFDYLVVLHGDDQADIRDLGPHLSSKEYTKYDCFLGARFMKGSRLMGYSSFRTFGNRVYNFLFSLASFRPVYDLGSGLNVYRLAKFEEFYYKTFPDDLTFNYVMLLGSVYRKQSVKFFPISWREEDQVSNVRLFSQAFKVLSMLCEYFFTRGRFLDKELRQIAFERYEGKVEYQHRVDGRN